MKTIFLYPGQLEFSSEPAQITTMLGSCVGVAIWDSRLKSGGLNHYLLPDVVGDERPSPRYGTFAMKTLIDSFLNAGSNKADLVARVYGGAAVLGQVSIGQKIGEKNIEMALNSLRNAGIKVADQNVGGERGRKISLNTVTGEVTHSQTGDAGASVDVSGFGSINEARDVKVLIVDDSATVRSIFEKIFTKNGLKVVGAAANPYEAREMIVRVKPDVITLDIEMPQMNGVRFLEKMMKHMPIPTVMVSSLNSQGDAALESMRLGAVEFVQKPSQYDPEMLRNLGQTLVTKVRAAATVNLLKQRASLGVGSTATSAVSSPARSSRATAHGQVLGIFVSGNTSAPKSLTKMLASFNADSPPVVIAVSTVCAFLPAFIADLKKQTSADLRIADDGALLLKGVVYFVPGHAHGKVVKNGNTLMLRLEPGAPRQGQVPSGDHLLESAALALGPSAVGILLSGFGSDGVEGLARIHGKGGYTMAESPTEAGFPFVPQTAISQGIVQEVVRAQDIFASLMSYRDRRVA
jgi:two-component system chemotaxis response regulator CheB